MGYLITDPGLAHAMEAYRLEQPPDREEGEEEKPEQDWCWFRLWKLMDKFGNALVSNFVGKGGDKNGR